MGRRLPTLQHVLCIEGQTGRDFSQVADLVHEMSSGHMDFCRLSIGGKGRGPWGALPLHVIAQTTYVGAPTGEALEEFYAELCSRSRPVLDTYNSAGKNALHIACAQGNVALAEALLYAGAGS